jgi:hypothetical protein
MKMKSKADLPEVIGTTDPSRGLADGLNRGQQHTN